MNVIVIEDDQTTAALLDLMLRVVGEMNVTKCTTNFAAVLDDVDWSEVDAVVCDHQLGPGQLTGEQILTELGRAHPHIRRVMLTGSTEIEEKPDWAEAVLIKGGSIDLLVKTVRGGDE